ncbi:MAG: rod-binding protein [Planctomycetes bacterium]|nr:rod-binding protein [Planctomycetota bacterium]
MIQEVAKPAAGAAGAAAPRQEPRLKQLDELARAFESFFVQTMMKTMRSTVQKSGFLDGGLGESVFTDLFDVEVANRAGEHGDGMGIAKMLVNRYAKYLKPAPPASFDRRG